MRADTHIVCCLENNHSRYFGLNFYHISFENLKGNNNNQLLNSKW